MALRRITPEIRAFLESMKVPCVISTLRPDGAPITSATWYGLLGDDVIVATPADRNKARNVRVDPRISFIVDTKSMPMRGVAIEGTAEILQDPDGSYLKRIVDRYLGPEAADAMRARLAARGERVILRIRPDRVRPWRIESSEPDANLPESMTRPRRPETGEPLVNWDISHPDLGYQVTIPRTTIAGEAVSMQSGERNGVHILHAESPDLSEVYFEVAAYPEIRDHAKLVAEQRGFLAKNAPDGAVTEPTQANVQGRVATSFEFRGTLQGRWKVRRFLFVDDARTYRVVYDPRSSRNEDILKTLELGIRP